MNVHSRARSCPASRVLLVERITVRGWPVDPAAAAVGLSRRSAFKWLRRYREHGVKRLNDRQFAAALHAAGHAGRVAADDPGVTPDAHDRSPDRLRRWSRRSGSSLKSR